jgi:CopG family transcriptional regulator, nickel-responsive regulator
MQRITIALDDALVAELDTHMAATRGSSRSETVRDLVRRGLLTLPRNPEHAGCFGIVSYAVDQSVRKLAAQVPQSRLDRHDEIVASLSVPIDHSTFLDVDVMRGRVADVTAYAEALFLERGVLHGTLGLVPVAKDTVTHVHNDGPPHVHSHFKVKNSF